MAMHRYQDLNLEEPIDLLVTRLDGSRTIAKLSESPGLDRTAVLRALDALRALGLVELVPPGKKPPRAEACGFLPGAGESDVPEEPAEPPSPPGESAMPPEIADAAAGGFVEDSLGEGSCKPKVATGEISCLLRDDIEFQALGFIGGSKQLYNDMGTRLDSDFRWRGGLLKHASIVAKRR